MSEILHYDVVGNGPLDILLIHGWASSSRIFSRIATELGDLGRYWFVDLPGLGQSPVGEFPATVQTHTNVMRDFCHTHHLNPDLVIAHSMGGMIALKLALSDPDLFDEQILICPTVTGNVGILHAADFVRTAPIEFVLRHSEVLWNIVRFPLWEQIFPLPVHGNRDKLLKATIWEDFRSADWATCIECLVSMTHENLQPELHKVDKPTLVIVGERDITVPASEGHVAADYLPDARLLSCKMSMHLPHEEQPDLVIPAIRTFIEEHHPVAPL